MEVEHRVCQEIKLLKIKGLLFLVGENVSRNDKRDRQKCSVGGGVILGRRCVGWAPPLSLTLSLKGEGTVGQKRVLRS
jgi:hypothetical protein